MNRLFGIIADYIRECDKILLALCTVTTLFGCFAVLSAGSGKQFIVQFVALIIGILFAVAISKIDYKKFKKYWLLTVIVGLVPVLLTFYIGYAPDGTDDKAWLLLPGGISFQPAELLKIVFIITFSLHLSTVKDNITKFYNIVLLCLHGAAPVVLIHLQGDDGTAMVFAVIFICMMFIAGVQIRYFIIAAAALVVALPMAYFYLLNDDQKTRILSLFNIESDLLGTGWQQWQGRVAFANGGILGKGPFNGDLVQAGSIPEGYNDFILTSIGEELGLIGVIITLILLVAICLRIQRVSHFAADSCGELMCVGVFSMIAAQVIINVGMCVSWLPVIGVTLPFFSAGGTSLCCLYSGIGLVLSVYMHRTSRTIYLHDN